MIAHDTMPATLAALKAQAMAGENPWPPNTIVRANDPVFDADFAERWMGNRHQRRALAAIARRIAAKLRAARSK